MLKSETGIGRMRENGVSRLWETMVSKVDSLSFFIFLHAYRARRIEFRISR